MPHVTTSPTPLFHPPATAYLLYIFRYTRLRETAAPPPRLLLLPLSPYLFLLPHPSPCHPPSPLTTLPSPTSPSPPPPPTILPSSTLPLPAPFPLSFPPHSSNLHSSIKKKTENRSPMAWD